MTGGLLASVKANRAGTPSAEGGNVGRVRRARASTSLGLVGALVVAEVGSRILWQVLDKKRGLRLTHQIRRDWLTDLPECRMSSLVPVPYGLYWNRSRHVDAEGRHQTNSLGYRQGAEETIVPKPEETFRILVLGSSTTFSDAGAPLPSDAWPAKLKSHLPGPPPGFDRVEVLNAGLNYALSTELLMHLMLVGLHVEPDMVVWEGPGNDWLPAAVGDTSPDYRGTRVPGEYPRPRFGERALVKRSFLARLILALWLRATRSTGLISLEPEGVDWSSKELADRIRNDPFDTFRRNVELVAEVCQARNIPLLLIPFTTGTTKSQLLSGLRSHDFLEARASATRRLNQVMAEVAAEHPGNTTYLAQEQPIPDHLYLDGTHLLPEGEGLKAAWVAYAVARVIRDWDFTRR